MQKRNIALLARDEFVEPFKKNGYEVLWLLPLLYSLFYEDKSRVILEERQLKERFYFLQNEILKFKPSYFFLDQCFFFMLLNRLENIKRNVMAKLCADFIKDLNKNGIITIIRSQDDPVSLKIKEALPFIRNFGVIAVHSLQAQKLYEAGGQKVIYMPDFVPLGYYKNNATTLSTAIESANFKANFDVFFVGAMNLQRKLFFSLLSRKVRNLDFFFGSKKFYYSSRKNIDFDVTNYGHLKKIYKESAVCVAYGSFCDSFFKKGWGVSDRAFSIGYCRGFFLHDRRRHLTDLFDIEPDLYTFKSLNDCYGKIKFYLENKDLRGQLAEKFYNIVIQRHTVDKRVADFITELENN